MIFRRRFTIESALPLGEATIRLNESIGPARTTLFERTHAPFMGRLRGGSFDIIRTSHGRNSVRPRIRGSLEAGLEGTRLHGTMNLHELVIGLLAILALGPGMFLGKVWLAGVRSGRFEPFLVIFPGVVLLLLGALGAGFIHESRRALVMLSEILDARRSEFE